MRQRDVLEQWLVAKQMTLLMERADAFCVLRRTPVPGYDISFLITVQVPPVAAKPWCRSGLPQCFGLTGLGAAAALPAL